MFLLTMEKEIVGIFNDLENCFKTATNFKQIAAGENLEILPQSLSIFECKIIRGWFWNKKKLVWIFTGPEENFQKNFEKIQKLKLGEKNVDEKNETIKKIVNH